MPRIPYLPQDTGPDELVAPIRARRGGRLLDIDRMLLHSPPFVTGWGGFLRAVRTELALPYRLRELAICAVGSLTGCAYELQQHRPEFLRAGGSEAQFAALADVVRASNDDGLFDATERALLRLAVEMTQRPAASADAVAAARAALPDDQQAVELVGVIAAYNMVARFINTLDIQPE